MIGYKVYEDGTCEEIVLPDLDDAQKAIQLKRSKEAFWALSYPERVEKLIRERYTVSDELAILRQRDAKPEEFAEYNDYAEECKARAKEAPCP